MNVFVTGASGVLGNYIIKYLLKAGFDNISILARSGEKPSLLQDENISIIQGDILDINVLDEAVANADIIIHAAAEVSFHPREKRQMLTINIEGTKNVVNACIEHGVKKLIHVSSIAAIGKNSKGKIITEETEWENDETNTTYGISKYQSELEVWRGFAEGLDGVIVNPSIILGAGDWSRSSLAMWQKVADGLPYYPKGGTSIVDVRDVARFIVMMINSDVNHERFILAGSRISYKDLFTKMANALGVQAPPKELKNWMGNLFWRLEAIKSRLSGKRPIVTKETIHSSRNFFEYNNEKSLSIDGFSYTSLDKTIEESAEIFRQGKGLLKI